jgi:thiosulfate dehydrogenase
MLNLKQSWITVAILSTALFTAPSLAMQDKDYQVELPAPPEEIRSFTPPPVEEIPDSPFGDAVRYGLSLFKDTQQLRGTYVGNGMNCVNCHLDDGRKKDSAPLWAGYPMYPAYRKKNDHVNTIEERIQGCFTYSMNGTPPPYGSKVLTAMVSYHYWLSKGAPIGIALAGRGYPKLAQPASPPDIVRGKAVYSKNCSICHAADGQGTKVDGLYAFPPLWGDDSFNWGAGMHRINTAAGFIKANMPLGKPNSLSNQQAWDVAAYINSHERPQDPRFETSTEKTAEIFHDHQCYYNKNGDN